MVLLPVAFSVASLAVEEAVVSVLVEVDAASVLQLVAVAVGGLPRTFLGTGKTLSGGFQPSILSMSPGGSHSTLGEVPGM